jgi:hypothetical protein
MDLDGASGTLILDRNGVMRDCPRLPRAVRQSSRPSSRAAP